MPALGAGIHVLFYSKQDVDGRDKPGHDAKRVERIQSSFRRLSWVISPKGS
jgi:hypothetical protein